MHVSHRRNIIAWIFAKLTGHQIIRKLSKWTVPRPIGLIGSKKSGVIYALGCNLCNYISGFRQFRWLLSTHFIIYRNGLPKIEISKKIELSITLYTFQFLWAILKWFYITTLYLTAFTILTSQTNSLYFLCEKGNENSPSIWHLLYI